MEGGSSPDPSSVEAVFSDFKARRKGLIRAFTTDIQTFYKQCDPDKVNLCLYGNADGTWEVKKPTEDIPTDLPEPTVGINFVRDGMGTEDWLRTVAIHSDSWLLSVAYYFGGRFRFDKDKRDRLFMLINDLPTIAEVVKAKELDDDYPDIWTTDDEDEQAGDEDKQDDDPDKQADDEDEQDDDDPDEQADDEDEQAGDDDDMGFHADYEDKCGICGQVEKSGVESWIICHICEEAYHRKCFDRANQTCKVCGCK